MTGPKLNEAPVRLHGRGGRPAVTGDGYQGTRAQARYIRMSAYKAREVLDLIRGEVVLRAQDILRFCDRDAAMVVGKVLASAVANADHNDELKDPDELYVSACYADEGPTLKRWRPRARGRATRIRKRTCHITVIVARLPEDELARQRSARATAGRRARRAGQEAAEQRRRLGRRRPHAEEAAAEEVAPAEEEELAAEPEAVQPASAAESGDEEVAVEVAEASEEVAEEMPSATEAQASAAESEITAGPEQQVAEVVEETEPENQQDEEQ